MSNPQPELQCAPEPDIWAEADLRRTLSGVQTTKKHAVSIQLDAAIGFHRLGGIWRVPPPGPVPSAPVRADRPPPGDMQRDKWRDHTNRPLPVLASIDFMMRSAARCFVSLRDQATRPAENIRIRQPGLVPADTTQPAATWAWQQCTWLLVAYAHGGKNPSQPASKLASTLAVTNGQRQDRMRLDPVLSDGPLSGTRYSGTQVLMKVSILRVSMHTPGWE